MLFFMFPYFLLLCTGIAEKLAMTAYIVGGITALCVSSVLICYWLWRQRQSRNAEAGIPGLLPNMRWDQLGVVGIELRALFASNLFVQSWLRREAERRRVGGVIAMARARVRERDKSMKNRSTIRRTKKTSTVAGSSGHPPPLLTHSQSKKQSVRSTGLGSSAKYSVRKENTSIVSLKPKAREGHESICVKTSQNQSIGVFSSAEVEDTQSRRSVLMRANPLTANITHLRDQPLIESPEEETTIENHGSEMKTLCILNTGAMIHFDHVNSNITLPI